MLAEFKISNAWKLEQSAASKSEKDAPTQIRIYTKLRTRFRFDLIATSVFVIALIDIVLGLASAVTAAEEDRPAFYTKRISDEWYVFGRISSDQAKLHDNCSAQRLWPDGSYFQIRKDLNDDSVYLWMRNNEWSISDKNGTQYDVRINSFNSRNQWIDGSPMTFHVIDKNSIYSSNLDAKVFLKAVTASAFMKFVMPGSVPNFTVQFHTFGNQLISALAECISKSKDAGPVPDANLPSFDSPRATNSNKL